MNIEKKNELDIYQIIIRLQSGLTRVLSPPFTTLKVISFIAYLICMLLIWITRNNHNIIVNFPLLNDFSASLWIILITAFLLYSLSHPYKALNFKRACEEAGLDNHIHRVPILKTIITYPKNPNIKKYVIESRGVPLEEWDLNKSFFETSMMVHILNIEYGKDNRTIELLVAPGNYEIPEKLFFTKDKMSSNKNEIMLGEMFGETISFSLNDYPHCLIAGSTGSGKTILLKLIIFQLFKKGHEVTIADFKGGGDFGKYWFKRCKNIITDIDSLLEYLKQIEKELKDRNQLFQSISLSSVMK